VRTRSLAVGLQGFGGSGGEVAGIDLGTAKSGTLEGKDGREEVGRKGHPPPDLAGKFRP